MFALVAAQIVFSTTLLTPTASSAAVTPPSVAAAQIDQVYPQRAIEQRIEGTARYRLTVGADGSVYDCSIVHSSGSADLDEATCTAFAEARFEPARDGAGNGVVGKYENDMPWRLAGATQH